MAESTPPQIVVVDGIVGAGKTTLIQTLLGWLEARGVGARAALEPVEEWTRGGHLQAFYQGISDGGVCYNFQTYAHVTRLMAFETAWNRAVADGIRVLFVERWPTTDRYVFMENLRETVGARDMEKYERWWDFWHMMCPHTPDRFIYLRPSLDVCMERCHTRARDGEEDVSSDYQRRLVELHDTMFEVHAGETARPDVTVIDSEIDFRTPGGAQEELFLEILGASLE